jgi:hypothetical protein
LGLGGRVEDTAALGAVDNPPSCSDLDDGLGGHFHVAAHADLMLESGYSDAVLGPKEVEVDVSNAFVEKLGKAVVFVFKIRNPGFKVRFFALQPGQEVFNFTTFLGVGFFRGYDLRVKSFEFLHEIELPIFQSGDNLSGGVDFVGEGGVFLVSSRLELLLLVAGDGIALGTCVDFQIPPFNLDFFGTAFCFLEPTGGVGELLFARLTLLRQVSDLGLEASKALVSILQGEQLLDDIKHWRMMISAPEIIQRAVSDEPEFATACLRRDAETPPRTRMLPKYRSFAPDQFLASPCREPIGARQQECGVAGGLFFPAAGGGSVETKLVKDSPNHRIG